MRMVVLGQVSMMRSLRSFTKRHGTDLPTKLIKVIVSYYLDVLDVDYMEEIEHDNPNEMEEAANL